MFFKSKKASSKSIQIVSNETIRIRSMTLTSVMLGFYLIFAFFCNTYLPIPFLGGFLNFDISLFFLIPLVFICSSKWWVSAGIIGGLMCFIWAGSGGWVGAIFNIVVNLLTLGSFFVLKIVFIDLTSKKFLVFKLLLILFLSLIIIIFINCLLNGLIFTPLYWWTYSIIKIPSFVEAENTYNSNDSLRVWLLFVPKYWDGIFALYSAFNLLKFGVISILMFPLLLIMYKSNIVNNYFNS